MTSVESRVPVVGSLGYVEAASRQPSSFTATLAVEPDNRYFRHAISVSADGAKIGYVAPEVAANVYDSIAAAREPIVCPARRGSRWDEETSGVLFFLDLSTLAGAPAP